MSSEPSPAPSRKGRSGKSGQKSRSKLPLIVLGLLLALVAAGAAAMLAGLIPNPLAVPPPPKAAVVAAPKKPTNPTRLEVTALRSNREPAGLLVRAGGVGEPKPGGLSAVLEPGGLLRTDADTRVGLSGVDESNWILNHSSELAVSADAEAQFSVPAGEILLDVARRPKDPALRIDTPHGTVETRTCKLALTVTATGTSLRVARGTATLNAKSGEPIEVGAGYEALASASAAPSAQPMLHLGSLLAWAELAESPVLASGGMGGLGRLDARAPDDVDAKDQALALAEHSVRVRVSGTMARTEVEESFRNDTDQELEGIYRFPLPADASISELALQVDGEWHQAAFVEREQGARIWRGVIRNAKTDKPKKETEEYIWVPGPWRDPALLQWQEGGSFELRIFPIPAKGERRVRLAYTQRLSPQPAGRRYVYPLPESGSGVTVGRFAFDLMLGERPAASLSAQGYPLKPETDAELGARLHFAADSFTPSGELVIDLQEPGGAELTSWTFQGVAAVPAGKGLKKSAPAVAAVQDELAKDERPYVALALRPKLPTAQQDRPRTYTLVVDTSQSMYGERHRRAVQLVERVIADMDRRDLFRLLACDLDCQSLDEKLVSPSSQAAAQARSFLDAMRPAGSSDLSAMLRHAAAALATDAKSPNLQRIVLIGDGRATVGTRSLAELSEAVRALTGNPQHSLSAVGIGSDADNLVLSSLARAGGGYFLPYVPGQSAAAAALELLETGYTAALENATLTLPEGLTDSAPSALPTLRNGDELVITARMQSAEVKGEAVLAGELAGKPFERRYPLELTASEAEGNRFVPALWASARIDDLEREGGADAHERIVGLSLGLGVMSRRTSLLVLESQAMHDAFGVDDGAARSSWTGEEAEDADSVEADEQVYDLAGGPEGSAPAPASAGASAAAPAARARGAVSKSEVLDSLGEAGAEEEGRSERRALEPKKKAAQPDGQWMKKEWYRKAEVSTDAPVRKADLVRIDEAVSALEEKPDSRDRHRTLVRALSRVGNLERVRKAIDQWIERDAHDPEALTYLSDAEGRAGDQAQALRLLSGVVDLAADDVGLHTRLAKAFERAGMAEHACAHRETLAELKSDDPESLAAAIRCFSAPGREAQKKRALARIADEALRAKVEALAATPAPAPEAKGDLLLTATWEGKLDLDLSLITPQGTRVSWMGGRVNVIGDAAREIGKERLGFAHVAAGTYTIEIARTHEHDKATATGTLAIEALENATKIPFTLGRDRMVLGQITVRRMSRLVAE